MRIKKVENILMAIRWQLSKVFFADSSFIVIKLKWFHFFPILGAFPGWDKRFNPWWVTPLVMFYHAVWFMAIVLVLYFYFGNLDIQF